MRINRWIVTLTALAVTVLTVSLAEASEEKPVAADRIDAELARLDTLPVLVQDNEKRQKSVDRQVEVLREVAANVAADRLFWAVAQMEGAYVYLETLRFSASHPEIRDAGLDALQLEAEAFSSRVSDGEAELFGPGLGELPAAYRAVAESVFQRVRTTQDAALAGGGLYYLGKAQALLDFALFCRTLGTVPPSPSGDQGGETLAPPQVPALTEAITALDLEVLDLYSPASAADRPVYGPFVQLNVTIKKARELDAQGYRYGALYTYLDARLRLELFRESGATAKSAAADTETLHRQAAEWHQRLDGQGPGAADHNEVDHSLGRLFWQAATAALADEPTEDDRKQAGVIFNHVLPEYFRHLEETTK